MLAADTMLVCGLDGISLENLTQLADLGDMAAQVDLGFMLEESDAPKAAMYYQRAADQGMPIAHHNLALLYEEGRGVPQDYGVALRLYTQAADAGEMRAAVNLGLLYIEGKGTPVDYKQGFKWTRIAADGDHAIGQNNLGHIYENGLGVVADLERALHYYQLSADQGYELGMQNLTRLKRRLDVLQTDSDLSPPVGDKKNDKKGKN
jgi:TPR repeat protein